MSWQNKLDKQTKSVILQEAATKQQPVQPTVVDPLVTQRVSYINDRAPWMPANVQLSLAKNYASDQAVDKASELYARNFIDNPSSAHDLYGKAKQYTLTDKTREAVKAVSENKTVDRSFFEFGDPGVYGAIKGVSRVAISTGAAIPEALQTIFSLGTLGTKEGSKRSYSVKDALDSFSLVQLLKNWDDQGDGFFITEELQAQQSEAARRTRGMINGSAFTIGRGIASSVGLEEGLWYNGVSGFFDFMVTVAVPDPTKYAYRGVKTAGILAKNLPTALRNTDDLAEAVKFASGIVPTLTKADAASYRLALNAQAGLTKSLTGLSLDVQKWNRFMDVNPTAVKAIKEIAEEGDELAIAKKFDWKLSPETIQRLAKSKTPEAVKAELVNQYAIGASTLSTRIKDIQAGISTYPVKYLIEKTPLKNSRLLTNIPASQIVINGTDSDRIAAVKNMYLSLKSSGATEEALSTFTKDALNNFRAISTADDQRDAYKLYERFLKDTLKLNGVRDEVTKLLFDRVNGSSARLRVYMLDRMGNETDNGFMKTYGDLLKKHFPQSVWDEFMEKAAEVGEGNIQFARPMQLSQLFDRVQTLPDPRELRRLTNNPFIRETLNKVGVNAQGTKPFKLSRIRKLQVEEILDQPRYDEIQAKLNKMPAKNTGDVAMEKARAALLQEQDLLVKSSTKRVYTGEQALVIDVLDGLQNAIWKPLNLATIGYIMRNSIDAQVRMAIGGASGILNHPGEYISLILGETSAANKLLRLAKKYDLSTRERSVLGEQLTIKSKQLFGKDKDENNLEIQEAWKELRVEHAELLQMSSRKQGMNGPRSGSHEISTGSYTVISKAQGDKVFAEAVLDSLRLAHQDELQKTAAQGLVFNIAEDELLDSLSIVANKAENFREIDGIYQRGIGFKTIANDDIQGPGRSLSGLTKDERLAWLREHSKDIPYANVKNLTGNIPEVTFIAAFDRVPFGDRIVLNPDDFTMKFPNEELKLGSFVKLSDDKEGIVVAFDKSEAVIQPVLNGSATGQGTFKYHKDAIRLINRQPVDVAGTGNGLAQQYAKELTRINNDEGRKLFSAAQDKLDDFTNFFFQDLYGGKYVKTLERSPVFRKFYYDEISNQIGRLQTSEAQALITKLKKSAKSAGFGDDIGKYIGSSDTAAKLKQIASTPGNGTLKASDLDDYARLVGITKTKELLYDASNKNNLEDITRIIFPFASAWREIAGRYMSFMIEDPSRLARAARFANNLGQADPDGDGRGFIYEDPQTGDNFFRFPEIFGLPIALRAAGVKSFFEAPVKQLSQGMSWIPGVGPLAQIPMSFALRNFPETNLIVKTLLPYGKTGLSKQEIAGQFNPLPGAVNKLTSLIYSYVDTNAIGLNTSFASTLSQTTQANFASGDYDISTEEGFKVLEKDSLRDARTISLIKIAQQFFGPTSPQVGFEIKVGDKDIFVDEMVKVFSKMQQEDYDTAVPRFLKVFGNEAALYIGSKTKSEVPGLEASGEFGEWELKNQDLLSGKYKDVAAYFGPSGEFNYDVYNRQRSQGKRTGLNPREMIELAQLRIGSSKYSAARKLFGAFPTEAEREKLQAYRYKLSQDYPGFPPVAQFEVGKFENQLIKLEEIVKDPRLANNETVPSLVEYLNARKQILAGNNLKSLKSKKAQPYAESLYAYGNRLAEQNPQFDRIWQRLLSSEVED